MAYRTEHDSMGEVRVPADRYWGAQTERSRQNFPIGAGREPMPEEIIRAFAVLKMAAAMANRELKPEKMTAEKCGAIRQAAEEITITDNPRSNSTPFGTLPAETDLTILGKYTYTGNWWYVETKLDGQVTRGFIDRSAAVIRVDGEVYHGHEELGIPVLSPEGGGKTGMMTVQGSEDDAMIVRRHADRESPMVARVYGGDVFPCYGQQEGGSGRIWYRIWVDGVWGWFSSTYGEFTEGE